MELVRSEIAESLVVLGSNLINEVPGKIPSFKFFETDISFVDLFTQPLRLKSSGRLTSFAFLDIGPLSHWQGHALVIPKCQCNLKLEAWSLSRLVVVPINLMIQLFVQILLKKCMNCQMAVRILKRVLKWKSVHKKDILFSAFKLAPLAGTIRRSTIDDCGFVSLSASQRKTQYCNTPLKWEIRTQARLLVPRVPIQNERLRLEHFWIHWTKQCTSVFYMSKGDGGSPRPSWAPDPQTSESPVSL